MATPRFCPSCLTSISCAQSLRPMLRATTIRSSLLAGCQITPSRSASQKSKSSKTTLTKKQKAQRANMYVTNTSVMPQYPLVDAMRYIRASEVGYKPTSAKYELAIRFRTPKNGPVIRGQLKLPHPIRTDVRICVIAKPDSAAAKAAIAAGASLVGEESVFEAIKAGRIEFEKMICHQDSAAALAKANLGRILGPRGLMPSVKLGTVVKNVSVAVGNMSGGSEYRERVGVIRLAIGQLGYTPAELQANIKALMKKLKQDMGELSDRISKDIHEVVLSSTHGPGITLDGTLANASSPDPKDLATVA